MSGSQREGSPLARPLPRRTILKVAGLTGEDWLAWLDRGLDEPRFREGAGRKLIDLPYRDPAAAGDVDIDGMLAAVRERLRTPVERGA